MLIPHRKKSLAILFIALTLAVPFALAYHYASDSGIKPLDPFSEYYNDTEASPAKTVVNKMTGDKIYLVKDKTYLRGQTGIVFKGMAHGRIHLDLYLIELDPEVPYALNFTKESVSDGIWLNNVRYRLISAKKRILCLKIEEAYHTL